MLRPFLLLTLASSLASCCINVAYDCFYGIGDDIVVQFDTDSLNVTQPGYRRDELRGVYVVRYHSTGAGSPVDSIQPYLYDKARSSPHSFTLNRLFPMVTGVSSDFTQFSYRVVMPVVGRNYLLTDLEATGHDVEKNSHTCHENTRKRLRLDGQLIVADGQEVVATARLLR